MNEEHREDGEWHTAYVGLGANLGEPAETLRAALDELDSRADVSVRAVSEFHETEPVGGPPQPNYVNAAAELRTRLSPRGLLELLHEVEDRFGRERGVRNGPRTLDLDLLLYEQVRVTCPALKLPHPRMHARRFVLEPLSEIAPEAEHPVLKLTVMEMLRKLS
jgi:2-amino-4-hydroxy-6-hydroxymethyldihydropteridine diphosphokinase